jgi:hypothetical protein
MPVFKVSVSQGDLLQNSLHHRVFGRKNSAEMKIAIRARLFAEGNMYVNTGQKMSPKSSQKYGLPALNNGLICHKSKILNDVFKKSNKNDIFLKLFKNYHYFSSRLNFI